MEFEEEDETPKKKGKNPLIVSLESEDTKTEKQLRNWFNKDSFAGVDDEADEDVEMDQMMQDYRKRGGQIKG